MANPRIRSLLGFQRNLLKPEYLWAISFLWDGVDSEEKIGLWERVERKCGEKGIRFFEDVKDRSEKQEYMQLAMKYLSATVEVMPRRIVGRLVEMWREEMLRYMDALCLDAVQ